MDIETNDRFTCMYDQRASLGILWLLFGFNCLKYRKYRNFKGICHKVSASGGLRPQTPDPLPGFGPGPHWGTSVPQTPCAVPVYDK